MFGLPTNLGDALTMSPSGPAEARERKLSVAGPSLTLLPRRYSSTCLPIAGLPGASESCCVDESWSNTNGTGVPLVCIVTILRLVSHGVGLASVGVSCVFSTSPVLPPPTVHEVLWIAKVTGSIEFLETMPPQPGSKVTEYALVPLAVKFTDCKPAPAREPSWFSMSARIAPIPTLISSALLALTTRPRELSDECHRSSTPDASGAIVDGYGVGHWTAPAVSCASTPLWSPAASLPSVPSEIAAKLTCCQHASSWALLPTLLSMSGRRSLAQ